MMDITLIHPDRLRDVWDDIKTGLAKMPAEDWIAEDVYHAIKAGEAALHVAREGGAFVGFLVLRKGLTEFTRRPTLHVWLVYNVGSADVMTAGAELIHATAARIGAAKTTFGSPRIGWSKRYPLITATYEMPA